MVKKRKNEYSALLFFMTINSETFNLQTRITQFLELIMLCLFVKTGTVVILSKSHNVFLYEMNRTGKNIQLI